MCLAPVWLPLLLLGFLDARGRRCVRAPDRSNRSHLGPRPRPLVGRSGKPAARSIPAREGGATHRQQEAALQPFHLDCWPPESQRKTDPGQLTFIAFLSCSFLRNHKKLRFSSKAGWKVGTVVAWVTSATQSNAPTAAIPPTIQWVLIKT